MGCGGIGKRAQVGIRKVEMTTISVIKQLYPSGWVESNKSKHAGMFHKTIFCTGTCESSSIG